MSNKTYEEALAVWRAQADESVRRDWVSLAGLHWLAEGRASFGSDPACDLVLPAHAQPLCGALTLNDGQVLLDAAPGVVLYVNGAACQSAQLRSDAQGQPDRVTLGGITMVVIRRGERVGVRLWDSQHPALRSFGGRRWFPPDPAFRLPATFVPYETPKLVPVTNILGDVTETKVPGAVHFTLAGQALQLDVTGYSQQQLFVNFRDATSGHETYGAGRFLSIPIKPAAPLEIDFNYAVSPPCAFTAFATCPLPLRQNWLQVRVAAGELAPDGH
ncbi:DUF1684 domain-containing protein [Chloroflexia bacterium SDU3-3]|nr:DUF1684 domain-containing protein [Chloroflexia bacterium SDU3-3]